MNEIWLVRHAQSQNNANPVEKRQPDPALTELGRWQADALAKSLAQQAVDFDEYCVSGFRRALETAAPVASILGKENKQNGFRVWPEIHEVGGCYQGHPPHPLIPVPGLNPEEVRAEFPWAKLPNEWSTGGWNRLTGHETILDAIPRADKVAAALRKISAPPSPPHGRKRLLLVSHGEFIALLLSRLLTGEAKYYVRPRSLYNTSITKLEISASGCRLVELNQVPHLPPDSLSS